MINLKILLTAAVVVLASNTGCKPDKKVEPVNPYYCTMEINGVPYDIPYEKYYSLSGGGVTYHAGKIGTTEYEISFRRTNDFLQTELLFTFAGNTLPAQDTVILSGIERRASLLYYGQIDGKNTAITNTIGKLIITNKSTDSLTGNFYFSGNIAIAQDGFWEHTDSIVTISNGKFCIKPSNL